MVIDAPLDSGYSDYADRDRVPDQGDFIVETHRPRRFRVAYHAHASVEVNYLDGCEMEYSFSGRSVRVPERRMTAFWGAVPHSVTQVIGDGRIINLYVSFPRVLQWALPTGFVESLVAGEVLSAAGESGVDDELFARWLADSSNPDPAWRRLIL